MLIRRDALERLGGFASGWKLGEFIDWYARAVDTGIASTVVPEVVMRRRVHAGNTTSDQTDAQPDYTRALRAVLARRRGAA